MKYWILSKKGIPFRSSWFLKNLILVFYWFSELNFYCVHKSNFEMAMTEKLPQKWMKIRWWPNGWKHLLKMCFKTHVKIASFWFQFYHTKTYTNACAFSTYHLCSIKKSTCKPTIWHKIVHRKPNVFGLPSRILGFMSSRFFSFPLLWEGGGVGWWGNPTNAIPCYA